MKDKAKLKIWQIAEENNLTRVVKRYGAERIWEQMKVDEDIFTPLHETCLDVLKDLNKKLMRENVLLWATIFFFFCVVVSIHYNEGTLIFIVFMCVTAYLYAKEVL